MYIGAKEVIIQNLPVLPEHSVDAVCMGDFEEDIIINGKWWGLYVWNESMYKKLENKKYYHHTGYIGHLKEVKYATLMATKPEKAMELAVKGMVPDTTIGRAALTRLRVYKGTEHLHAAQKPETVEF